MPKSDWLAGTAITLVILFVALCGYWLGYKNHHQSNSRETSEQTYQESTDETPLGADVETQITNPQAYREEWRNEQDLKAQEAMAGWAKAMFFLGVASLVATFVGLIYVARTLRATRDGIDVSREIGQAQARGYFTIRRVELGYDKPSGPLSIFVAIQNSGQSPGRRVSFTKSLYADKIRILYDPVRIEKASGFHSLTMASAPSDIPASSEEEFVFLAPYDSLCDRLAAGGADPDGWRIDQLRFHLMANIDDVFRRTCYISAKFTLDIDRTNQVAMAVRHRMKLAEPVVEVWGAS